MPRRTQPLPTCLRVKWHLENLLHVVENETDSAQPAGAGAVTESYLALEEALEALEGAEDGDYQSEGSLERMQTWAHVARYSMYPSLVKTRPWEATQQEVHDALRDVGIEDTETLRALVAVLEHNLLCRQRSTVPIMIPSKKAPAEEISAILSFAALSASLLQRRRRGCQHKEEEWCREVTSALDVSRGADAWKLDNFNYVGSVLAALRVMRRHYDEMFSHRHLRHVVLKMTRVLPLRMVDRLAATAEKRMVSLEEEGAVEEARMALATIFGLPDTGLANGAVALLRANWSLLDLIEDVRAGAEDTQSRRYLVLVCELLASGLPEAAKYVRDLVRLPAADFETLVRDEDGAGVRLLLAALSDRMRSHDLDCVRGDLVQKLLGLLRAADEAKSNSVAWWLGLGSEHPDWEGEANSADWWWWGTPHPKKKRQELGRTLRDAWLGSTRLERTLADQDLLSSPAARLCDQTWASEVSTAAPVEDGWETASEAEFAPQQPGLDLLEPRLAEEEEAWPTLAEEGDHLYLEAAVCYAEKQELRDGCAFGVVTRDGRALEEGAGLNWCGYKSGQSLRLEGPSPGGLVQALPSKRSCVRATPLSDVVYKEMDLMAHTTGVLAPQLQVCCSGPLPAPSEQGWDQAGGWQMQQEEAPVVWLSATTTWDETVYGSHVAVQEAWAGQYFYADARAASPQPADAYTVEDTGAQLAQPWGGEWFYCAEERAQQEEEDTAQTWGGAGSGYVFYTEGGEGQLMSPHVPAAIEEQESFGSSPHLPSPRQTAGLALIAPPRRGGLWTPTSTDDEMLTLDTKELIGRLTASSSTAAATASEIEGFDQQ